MLLDEPFRMDQEAKGKMQLQTKKRAQKAMIMISKKNSFSDSIARHQPSPPASAPEISPIGNPPAVTGGVAFPPRVAASCPSQRQESPELVKLVTDVLKREGVAMNHRKRR